MKRAWQCIGAFGLSLSAMGACGSTSCFVRGTRVLTPRGLRRIEDLVVGDEVTSLDVETRRPVVRKVGKVLRAHATEILRISVGELGIAGVTAEHPFYSVERGAWLPAGELREGMRLLAWLGASDVREIAITAHRTLPSAGKVEVFNLTIDGPEHNYFAEGLLVHNKSTGGPFDDDPTGEICATDQDCAAGDNLVCAASSDGMCGNVERRCAVATCADGPLRTHCGCDGKPHAFDGCVGGSDIQIDKTPGACAPPAGMFNCGEGTCAKDTQYCLEGYSAITCVDFPPSCAGAQATCACLEMAGVPSCGCVISDGGIRVDECKR